MNLKLLSTGVLAAGLLSSAPVMAAQETVTVSATVVGTCKFNSGGSVDFGSLDPSVGTDVSGTVTQPQFWCTNGASYSITDDTGANNLGSTYRMKHATLTEYIPYTFTYTTSGTGSGPTSPINMDIAADVLGTDYTGASAGSYSDTVTLTITP